MECRISWTGKTNIRPYQNADKGIMNGCVFKDTISDIGVCVCCCCYRCWSVIFIKANNMYISDCINITTLLHLCIKCLAHFLPIFFRLFVIWDWSTTFQKKNSLYLFLRIHLTRVHSLCSGRNSTDTQLNMCWTYTCMHPTIPPQPILAHLLHSAVGKLAPPPTYQYSRLLLYSALFICWSLLHVRGL